MYNKNVEIIKKIKQIKRFRVSYNVLQFIQRYICYFGYLRIQLYPSLIERVYDKFQLIVGLSKSDTESHLVYIGGKCVGEVSDKLIKLK